MIPTNVSDAQRFQGYNNNSCCAASEDSANNSTIDTRDQDNDDDCCTEVSVSTSSSSTTSSPVAKRPRIQVLASFEVLCSPTSPAPQCPICLDSISISEEVRTPCGHTFCASCLRTILANEGANSKRSMPAGRRGRYRHWLSIQEEGGILKCPCCRRTAFPRQVVYTTTFIPLLYPLSSESEHSSVGVLRPLVTSIMGQTYVQVGGRGLASYHFESKNKCYLSYARAPDDWVLDDGSKPPTTKPFTDAHFDPDTRRFTGTVIWPVPFNGHGKWDYEMVFSKDYMIIERGGVTLRDLHDPSIIADRLLYEDHLFYENDVVVLSSPWNQTYVQGRREVGVASYHFKSLGDSYISYESSPSAWVLDNGFPPPERVYFSDSHYSSKTRTFTGNIDWEVPFFGDTRWEYTIVFSEDFGCVADGRCCAFDLDGRRARVWYFERDLYYHILWSWQRFVNVVYYVHVCGIPRNRIYINFASSLDKNSLLVFIINF